MHRRDAIRLLGSMTLIPLADCARRAAASVPAPVGDRGGAPGTAPVAGIQLYTLRTVLEKDPEPVLQALGRIGYREVEMAGRYGKSAAEFRAMLDRAGLRAPSTHIPIDQLSGAALDQSIADAKVLGNEWIVCPWLDESMRTPDGFNRLVDVLNQAGQRVHAAGLRFAYHNHDFEFKPLPDGMLPYDMLLSRTDADRVKMEMDLYWITKAGKDPIAYMTRYPGRITLVHVKDMDASGNMADVGQGRIDFARIFAADPAIEHYFVERDDAPNPVENARVSYAALSRLLGAVAR